MLEHLQTLDGHTDRVWTLAWNPAGTILSSSGADKTIRLWAKDKAEDWMCVSILTETHNKSIRRLCWSPCGTYLASASFDSTLCIWKRSPIDGNWSTVVNLEGHESEVKGIAWSPDGNYLASCGRDRTIWIWQRVNEDNDDRDLEDQDSAENWDCSDVKTDHSKDVKHIVWHPHYSILVSCSYDDTVKFFHKSNEDWACFETLAAHSSTVWSADFSSSGQYLVTCSDDKTVRIWKNHAHNKLPDVEENSWKCVSVIQGYHSRSIYDVSWSKVDDLIATGAGDNSLGIYCRDTSQSQDGSEIFTCLEKFSQAHDCDVNSVAWNPIFSNLLASGGDDRKIKLWYYSACGEGMKQLTIVDQIMQNLSRASIPKTNTDSNTLTSTNNDQEEHTTPESKMSLKIENHTDLANVIGSMQRLNDEIYQDVEVILLEKLLDLKFASKNQTSIELANIQFNEQEVCVNSLDVQLTDNSGQVKFRFEINIDIANFKLTLPRRSIKLTNVNGEIFLTEKTGDLYHVLTSGQCRFLVGHLFMLTDVKFITNKDDSEILYIVTSDRDEKIRISNWPDTFDIERFCFGHKAPLRRIVIIDEKRFISIDQNNEVCIWNLENLCNKLFVPEKTTSFGENVKKRICVR